MSGLPLVSIILVTYNAEHVLQSCLSSIFSQAYPRIELIVVDGGSSDNTVKILEINDSRIDFWLSEPDQGIYDAMNKALQHAKGAWIYFIGADDELLDDFSRLLYELKDPSHIYYGSVLKENKKYLGKLSAYHHAKTGICHQAMVYPAEVFNKYRFDTAYPISADHILNMWCWKDKEFEFEFRDYIIARFNHTGVSSLKKDRLFEKRKGRLILENYGPGIWLRFLFKMAKAKVRAVYLSEKV